MRKNLAWIIACASILVNILTVMISWPFLRVEVFHIKDDAMFMDRTQPAVYVARATVGPISARVPVVASVKARDSVTVVSEGAGKIEQIHFKQGDEIKKGDVLITLESGQARADVRAAEARLSDALNKFKRLSALQERGKTGTHYVTSVDLKDSEARYEVAKAELEKAKIALENTRITASMDGWIGLCSVGVGDRLGQHQEITRIVDLTHLSIEFSVTPKVRSQLNEGQEVSILAEDFHALVMTGKIVAIEPYADSLTHMFRVRAEMENADLVMRDGGFARVMLGLSETEALKVPEQAILQEGDQTFVFLYAQGRASKRAVTVGARDGAYAQIIEGISKGDVVITDPVELLADNAMVRVVPQKGETSPRAAGSEPQKGHMSRN